MTQAEANTAIVQAFNTAWGVPGVTLTPIKYDNIEFDAANINVPWVALNVQFTGGEIASIGTVGGRNFRNFGLVFVQVFTPSGSNRLINDGFARTAKNVFRGVQLGTMWFRNAQVITVGNEGKWFQQNVSAEFIYDETE